MDIPRKPNIFQKQTTTILSYPSKQKTFLRKMQFWLYPGKGYSLFSSLRPGIQFIELSQQNTILPFRKGTGSQMNRNTGYIIPDARA